MGFLKFPWFIKFPRSWRRSLCDAASEEAAKSAGIIFIFTIFDEIILEVLKYLVFILLKRHFLGFSVTMKRLIIKVKLTSKTMN